MKRALPLFAALALAACATVPASTDSPTAGIGQVASVGGLAIRPLALIEDSRCPASVQCVWAGQVRIRAILAPQALAVAAGPNAPATAVARETNMTLGVPVTEFGRTITLTAVTPIKSVPGSEADPRSYRFTFEYSR